MIEDNALPPLGTVSPDSAGHEPTGQDAVAGRSAPTLKVWRAPQFLVSDVRSTELGRNFSTTDASPAYVVS